jgi:LysR family transcriptional activator of glutamate synthase operon
MELHQLEYVIKVAEHMNFTHASEQLHLAQPSLSQQILKLEEELGIRLFKRSTRSVKLTPAGEEFIVHAKLALSEVSKACQAVQEYIEVEKGRLVIGGMPMICYLGLIQLIADFILKYPGVEIEVKEAGTLELLEMLYSSKIDVALMYTSEKTTPKFPIDIYPLIEDEIVLITPLFHPLADKKTVEAADLIDQRWIIPKESSSLSQAIETICQTANFEPKVVCKSSHAESVAGLVAAGLGVSILSRHVASSVAQRNFSIIKLLPTIVRTTSLTILTSPHQQSTLTAFKNFSLNWTKLHGLTKLS